MSQVVENKEDIMDEIRSIAGIPNSLIVDKIAFTKEHGEIQFYYPNNLSDGERKLINEYYALVFSAYLNSEKPQVIKQVKIPYDDFSKRFGAVSRKMLEDSSEIQNNIQRIVNEATAANASDIHFDAKGVSGEIRARIAGDLRVLQVVSFNEIKLMFSIVYNTMCRVDESMYQEDKQQNAMFKKEFLNKKLTGIRVATTPSVGGGAMVLRLLYHENIELDPNRSVLEQLGYRKQHEEVFKRFTSLPSGVIIIAGATGSGKSTTLKYIMTDMAKDDSIQIITVEDPPEYIIPNARQIPVYSAGTEEERSKAFAAAIRSILRQDPNKIMIGEIRDCESAIAALRCALTGHQVWSTIHANSTFAIIGRLADVLQEKMTERGANRMLVDPSLINGLLFQRLIPELCPHCRISIADRWDELDEQLKQRLISSFTDETLRKRNVNVENELGERDPSLVNKAVTEYIKENVYLRNHKGCEYCSSGKKSRRVIAEVIYTDGELLEDIIRNSVPIAYQRWRNNHIDETINAHARELIIAGILDPRDAERSIGNLDTDIVDAKRYKQKLSS